MISNSRPTRSIFSTTSIDDYADRLQLHPSIPFSAYDLICWVRKFTSGGLRPISFRLYELFIYSTLSRFILCNTLFLILFTDYTNAVPRRVQEPWTVVLCKFKGNPAEPHSASWIKEWIDGAHPDSLAQFFWSLSNGLYSISGSNVTEWIELPWTRHEVLQLAELDPDLQKGSERPFALFDKAKQLCVGWARTRGVPVHRKSVTLLNSERTAIFGRNNGVLITPKLAYTSVLAHEMVHSMNIGHSYSERRVKVFPHASMGEYGDRYDLMSTANAWMRPSKFGWAGPGLSGPHLDYLGWLPANRVYYLGRFNSHALGNNPSRRQTIRLSSLSLPHASTSGLLLLMIPYDRDNPANMYTVEFRTPVHNDAGIQQAAIVIHNVRQVGRTYYSFLVSHSGFDELTADGTEWVRFIDGGHGGLIRLRVEKITDWEDAQITVITTFSPKLCRHGEVRKKVIHASDEDFHSSSTPSSRLHEGSSEKTLSHFISHLKSHLKSHELDEGVLTNEISTAKTPKPRRAMMTMSPFRPYREPLRYVCLESQRPYNYMDLKKQREREDFYRKRVTYGQNECVEGRVWRNIDPYDYVCVPPYRVAEARQATHLQNKNGVCPFPLVPRMAFPFDRGCVTNTEKSIIQTENQLAESFYKHAVFFNGADSLLMR